MKIKSIKIKSFKEALRLFKSGINLYVEAEEQSADEQQAKPKNNKLSLEKIDVNKALSIVSKHEKSYRLFKNQIDKNDFDSSKDDFYAVFENNQIIGAIAIRKGQIDGVGSNGVFLDLIGQVDNSVNNFLVKLEKYFKSKGYSELVVQSSNATLKAYYMLRGYKPDKHGVPVTYLRKSI